MSFVKVTSCSATGSAVWAAAGAAMTAAAIATASVPLSTANDRPTCVMVIDSLLTVGSRRLGSGQAAGHPDPTFRSSPSPWNKPALYQPAEAISTRNASPAKGPGATGKLHPTSVLRPPPGRGSCFRRPSPGRPGATPGGWARGTHAPRR